MRSNLPKGKKTQTRLTQPFTSPEPRHFLRISRPALCALGYIEPYPSFCRPYGTWFLFLGAYPGLTSGATLWCPYGAEAEPIVSVSARLDSVDQP
jgi:hypothetical protein